MNILKKPIAVVLLAALATVLVFQRVVWPLIKQSSWHRQMPVAAQAALDYIKPVIDASAEQRKLAANGAVAPGKVVATPMELTAVEGSAVRWNEVPRRDPFQKEFTATNQVKAYPPAMELLHLTAIWRQSGSTLAVVNNQVIGEGESVLRFTIQSIDENHVWVTGPNGRESVGFKLLSAEPTEPETVADKSGGSPVKPNQ